MASTDLAFARSFDELARLVDRTASVEVRIERSDGSVIEGAIHDVDYADLLIVEQADGSHVEVFARDFETLDVNVPRRGREWMLALVGIVVATVGLIGYAQLPWVSRRPRELDMIPGFLALMAIAAGLGSIPPLRQRVASWFTSWQRIYPTRSG